MPLCVHACVLACLPGLMLGCLPPPSRCPCRFFSCFTTFPNARDNMRGREREREREKTMRGRGGACSDCRVAKEMEREGERDREKDGQNEAGVPLTASCGLAAWLFAWPFACMFACLPSCPTRCRHVCLISCLTLHSETREWGDRTKRERERHSIRIWPLGWVAGDLSGKLARGVAELLGGEMAG